MGRNVFADGQDDERGTLAPAAIAPAARNASPMPLASGAGRRGRRWRWWPGWRRRASRRSRGRSCSGPESIPVSSSARAGEHGDGDRDEHDAEADAGDEHAGQHIGGVAAVPPTPESSSIPAAATANPPASGTRTPAWVMTWVAAWTPTPIASGQRQERQPGLQRAGAEHVLQVQRGQQEGAEQHGRGGQHHHEAAADARGRRGAGRAAAAAGCAVRARRRRRARRAPRRRCRASASRSSRAVSACERAKTSAPRLAVASSAPRRSRPRQLRPRGVGGHDAQGAGGEQRAPTGRLMKKIARQSTSSVSAPPSSTPMAAPAPPTAPQTPSALARSRAVEGGRDDRQRGRGEHRGAEALAGAGGEQRGGVAGERRDERGGGEHAQAGEEHAPAAEQVGGAAAEQQQAAEDQRVAGDRPADVAAGRCSGPRARSGSATFTARDVEDDHELGDGQQRRSDQRMRLGAPGAVAVFGVRWRPCMGASISNSDSSV